MTIINHQKAELHIIIKASSPEEEKEVIMKALIACVRWFGCLENGDKRTKDNEDGQNLAIISEVINNMIPTQTIEQ